MQYATQVAEGWAIREAPLRWVKSVIKKMPQSLVYQRVDSNSEWVLVSDHSTLPIAKRKTDG